MHPRELLLQPQEAIVGITAAVGGEQHRDRGGADLHPLGRPLIFGQSEAAVGQSAGTITPEAGKFAGEQIGQLGAVEAQQVVHIAPGGGVIQIAVDAGGAEVGRAGHHHAAVHHHELVVHQAAAAAAVGGVVDQGHPPLAQDRHRIPLAEGRQLGDTVALVRIQGRLVVNVEAAPGGAVGVLQHHRHP